jgi:hypothetical protein
MAPPVIPGSRGRTRGLSGFDARRLPGHPRSTGMFNVYAAHLLFSDVPGFVVLACLDTYWLSDVPPPA